MAVPSFHAGERTWRNLLKSDASVDLVHFTILRPPEKQDGTPINELSLIAFPTRELFQQKIGEFQLIIFDRYARQGVLPLIYFDNIAKYVRDGGAVLIAAGPDYASPTSIWRTPLDGILPAEPTGEVTERRFQPQLSDAGRRHPVTRDLEGSDSNPPHWSNWFRLVDIKRSTGTNVMQGPDGKPLLVLGREGQGRVALLLSDHIWLWARGYEGGGPHLDLLRRLSHWLMAARHGMRPDDHDWRPRAHTALSHSRLLRRHHSGNSRCRGGTGRDLVDPHPLHGAHVAHLKNAKAFGVTIAVGGPLVSDDGATSIGSLMVLETSDRASAEKFNRADPFHQNGVWGKVEIRRFDRKE